MSWKISVSVPLDAEALLVVERMIYAAAKAEGATDLEASSAAHSLREAIPLTDGASPEMGSAASRGSSVQIDLEYDEETVSLFVRGHTVPPGASPSRVRH